MCENPVKIFGIQNKGFIKEGYDADFTIVDMNKKIIIKNKNIESKCRWSPFNEVEFKGTPVATIIAGKTKIMPEKFYNLKKFDVTKNFINYCKPLIGKKFPETTSII